MRDSTSDLQSASVLDEASSEEEADIAIVGLSCRFPNAANPDAFWNNLRVGHEALSSLDDEKLAAAGVDESLLANPDYVKAGMFLEDFEAFDAGFFGFSPREALIMDPQHRVFLETCWEALENAGHDPEAFSGPIGVFAGSGQNAYLPYNLLTNPDLVEDVGLFLLRHTGNDKDFLTTRVSYCLDLKGPSVAVQSACSTSLVAVHLAAQSLSRFECDMALAGGVTIELPRHHGYLFRENEILSPDGHCRPFDARANGTVFGSGAGVVTLRRLEDALRDGDKVHAIIRSSAVNNDGKEKVSYLAPSVDGQTAAIEEALGLGDIDPSSVSYIECHGTGTRLGDPIEVAALTQAYGGVHGDLETCSLGSVKSNIGHLDTAAGVAGLIKVVQALKHGELPPTLHFESPNPAMNLERTPFSVQSRLKTWESEGPRRAGINSLGVGGTNAHAIVEQAPEQRGSRPHRQQQLLVLSARSPEALEHLRARYVEHLDRSDQPLADITHTAANGRRAFEYRCCVVGTSGDGIARCLDGGIPDSVFLERRLPGDVNTVFLFAGGGAQYPNMGLGLYEQEPVYREALDRCLAAADRVVNFDLRSLLFPEKSITNDATPELERPSRALPALLSVQYAQACLWKSWGVTPSACIGHSMGEYTAACLADVFTVEDALSIVAKRGELFERLERGAMLSVMLSEAALIEAIGEDSVSIAAVNGPELCVASGPESCIARLAERLESADVACQRIHISVAAHSTMVEPILEEFQQFLHGIDFRAPTIPVVSNLTGSWLTEVEARDPDYWVRHLRETVRFNTGLELLLGAVGSRALLEVGPGKTLISAARQHPDVRNVMPTYASMRHVRESADDQAFMLATLGRLWGCGAVDDLAVLHDGETRLRVELPTYPFEHQSYWVEPGSIRLAQGGAGRQSMNRWLYRPDWRAVPAPSPDYEGKCLAILFGDRDNDLVKEVREALSRDNVDLIEVESATAYQGGDGKRFGINPTSREDYQRLFVEVGAQNYDHVSVMHGWTLGAQDDTLHLSFNALLAMAQAIGDQGWNESMLCVVASGSLSVGQGDILTRPVAASMLGACRVIPEEIADLRVRYIDTDSDSLPSIRRAAPRWLTGRTAAGVASELLDYDALPGQAIAYRLGQRLEQIFGDIESVASPPVLSNDGCYLISGGLGALGLEVAGHLANRLHGIRLVLLARNDLPPRETWPDVVKRTGRSAERVRAVLSLEAQGARVRIAVGDVCDRAALEQAVTSTVGELGPIRGVMHTAGVIQDRLLAVKTAEEASAVLAPKIDGTVNLSECTADQPLEFFILFSSTSAVIGLPGQIDYAAGNAFMDAFACHRRSVDGLPMTSVNWSAWRNVGMAAEIASGKRAEGLGFERFEPVFKGAAYRRCLSTGDWLLDEHRTKAGTPLVPGTGFLELSRCAARASGLLDARRVLELRDVFFVAPLIIRDGEQRVMDVSFQSMQEELGLADTPAFEFSSRSAASPEAADAGDWLSEHVQGIVTTVSRPLAPVQRNMDVLIERCNRSLIDHGGTRQHDHMDFGERWGCLQRIYFGDGEALAELVLAQPFEAELSEWELHPAMMDMITAAAFRLAPDYLAERDFFVPVSYGRVTFHDAMQHRLFGHIRIRRAEEGNQCRFDLQVYSDGGSLLVDVADFVAKRMSHDALDADVDSQSSAVESALDSDDALTPEEGRDVIDRLLAGRHHAQLLVSPTDFGKRLVDKDSSDGTGEAEGDASQAPALARPDSMPEYVAPESDVEKGLAELWQKALGIDKIGIDDNFFELGGHSLMLTQLVGRARKRLDLKLPTSRLFANPTIRHWLATSEQDVSHEQRKPIASIKRVARDAYRQ